ncbi:MAG: hypothetical protein R2810_16045 [Flavobacteriales bacterium]
MKRPFLLSLLVLTTGTSLLAQVPQQMTYQAVVRDASDQLVVSGPVGLQLSIRQGSDTGPAVYVETHATTTNANGLTGVVLGGGNVVSGSMAGIDWTAGPYFLQTETDPTGGTTYTISGTAPLLSVPYALYAQDSGSSQVGPQGPPGPPGMPGVGGCDPNDRDSLIVLYNFSDAYGYHQDPNGNGQWVTHALGGTSHSKASSKRAVVLYNFTQAHAFYLDNAGAGQWAVQALGSTSHNAATTDRVVVLYNNSTAHAFHVDGSGNGVWTSQTIGSTNHSAVAHGGKIIVFNNTNAWAFSVDNSGNGAWTVQPLGGTSHSTATTQ